MQKAGDVLRDELGRPYWGTVGKYVKKNQLLGFIEQMGHEYQDLLMGATEEEGENISKPDPTALMAATDRALNSLTEGGDGGRDDSDDDEEEQGEEGEEEEEEEEEEEGEEEEEEEDQSKGSKSDEEEGNCGRK